MTNPVTVPDLESRWRPLSGQEMVNASTFLQDAWSYLTDLLPSLESRVASGDVKVASVTRVVSAAVLRVLRNPEGHESGTRAIDDYRVSWSLSEVVRTGELYFTDGELQSLSLSPGGTGAWTIRPTGVAPRRCW